MFLVLDHIKAVVFDVDGTLRDNIATIHRVVEQVCQYYDAPAPSLAKFQVTYVRPYRDYLRGLGVPVDRPGAWKTVCEIHDQIIYQDEKKFFPDINECLNAIYESGRKIIVASANRQDWVKGTVNALGVRRLLSGMVWGEEKYDFLKTVHRVVGCKPKEVAFVDDMPFCIRYGKSLGLTPVGFCGGGYDTGSALQDAGADHVVANYRDLRFLLTGTTRPLRC